MYGTQFAYVSVLGLIFLRFLSSATTFDYAQLWQTTDGRLLQLFEMSCCPCKKVKRHGKLAHQSQSQYCATFPSHVWSILWIIKYLGLPVLTKYFVKNYLFLSWGRPQFSLFYPNFGPFLHLQYMKIYKKKNISTKL